ncbi:MAG: Gfo/Idh/MocA family oxidoreductase [Planctomycetota bacterium]|nr:Gfo/Idh/MocA family oxidoreductase [Planctomycetota bacterium]
MAKKRRTIGVGIVGMGFMGLTHLRAARRLKGAKVLAIVTSDPRKARGDFSGVKGNFGAGGDRESLEGIRIYPDVDTLLADERIGLVDVCLPSYLHARAAVRCLRAGKSVLVEKPMALKASDAQRMLATAKRTRRLLMVAQVLNFFPEFASLAEAVNSRRHGRLLSFHSRRIIAMPTWSDDSWFGDPELSGGMVVDLHIHDTDFTVHLFGKPRAVTSHGLVRGGQIHSIRTVYDLGSRGPLLSSEAGWVNAPSLAFEHGYDAFFEKATIHYDSSHCPIPRVYGPRSHRNLRLPKGDAFQKELQAVCDSVKSGRAHPLLSAKSAAVSLSVCLAEQKSVLTGRRVRIP